MSSKFLALFFFILALTGQVALAGVTAERTRVVFPEGGQEASLLLVNANNYPVLTQTWVDDGRLDSTPDQAVAPILPLPAVFRLEPKERRSLRLLYAGDQLPADRESLFWLNIYEVPPEPRDLVSRENSQLTITLRTQIKVFYRPKALSPAIEKTVEKLTFALCLSASGAEIEVRNPGPYHMTLSGLVLQLDSAQLSVTGDMVLPFSKMSLPIKAPLSLAGTMPEEGQVTFSWIDDDGLSHEAKAIVSAASKVARYSGDQASVCL